MLPVVVWIDDEFAVWQFDASTEEMLATEGDGTFEVKFFKETDAAIEFTLENLDRVFLFIQDSSRVSKLLDSWTQLRSSNNRILPRTTAGAFYTHVIDAFAPEACSIFAGYGYGRDDEEFISEWSAKDERIVLADKWSLSSPTGAHPSGQPNLATIARRQLARWSEGRKNRGRSTELELLDSVLEEMTMLCSINRSRLHKLSPRQFEELVAYLFKNHGFDVELTARTRDGGYDIVLADHSGLQSGPILVECKQFAPDRPVGVGIVRALYGVKYLNSASKAILATSSYVSKDAKREFGRVIPWELELYEGNRIKEMCESCIPTIFDRRLPK